MSGDERELLVRMRDDAAANGDYAGAADLDAMLAAAAPVPAPATDGPPSAPTEGGPGLCANHWPTEEADCPTCGPQALAEAACYRVNTPHVAHPWMVDGKTWQCPGIPASAPTGEGTDTP